eukprot:3230553-Prymnesium_polylepis.1
MLWQTKQSVETEESDRRSVAGHAAAASVGHVMVHSVQTKSRAATTIQHMFRHLCRSIIREEALRMQRDGAR